MRPYLASDAAWFCPLDPHARENVLWLGQRHRLSSYAFAPAPAENTVWPPKAQLGHTDTPLLTDAAGIPAKDSDRRFQNDRGVATNHPNGVVNVLAQDMSLSRHRATAWVGVRR